MKRNSGSAGLSVPVLLFGMVALVLRRTLYKRLGSDNTLSFCYSDDPSKSRTDEEIISNWASKKADGVSTAPSR